MLIKLPENQDIERTSYYWSPDGRYVAFWWIPDIDEFPVVMAVLDMETHEFVDYGIQNLYSYKYAPEIFWSPDSQYVLFQVWEEIDSEFSKLVIVDIHEGRAAQIEENVVPYGWMTDSEP